MAPSKGERADSIVSNSIAFLAPPGADLAIRFGMYRTAGISGETAEAGLILSWLFATGYKLVVPIVALTWVLLAERLNEDLLGTITLIGLAGIIVVGVDPLG
jgi:hypothetical protein